MKIKPFQRRAAKASANLGLKHICRATWKSGLDERTVFINFKSMRPLRWTSVISDIHYAMNEVEWKWSVTNIAELMTNEHFFKAEDFVIDTPIKLPELLVYKPEGYEFPVLDQVLKDFIGEQNRNHLQSVCTVITQNEGVTLTSEQCAGLLSIAKQNGLTADQISELGVAQ